MDPTAYYYMPLFKPGTFVQWNHQRVTPAKGLRVSPQSAAPWLHPAG